MVTADVDEVQVHGRILSRSECEARVHAKKKQHQYAQPVRLSWVNSSDARGMVRWGWVTSVTRNGSCRRFVPPDTGTPYDFRATQWQ